MVEAHTNDINASLGALAATETLPCAPRAGLKISGRRRITTGVKTSKGQLGTHFLAAEPFFGPEWLEMEDAVEEDDEALVRL